jgi:hypothetical protein
MKNAMGFGTLIEKLKVALEALTESLQATLIVRRNMPVAPRQDLYVRCALRTHISISIVE